MRTVEEFKEAVAVRMIIFWPFHNCSMCDYACGFIFFENQVEYDSGCDCVSYSGIRPSSWDEVAEMYNAQKHPDVIKKMDAFWGFSDGSKG